MSILHPTKAARRAALIAKGVCPICTGKLERGYMTCRPCRIEQGKRQKLRRNPELPIEVYTEGPSIWEWKETELERAIREAENDLAEAI